MPVGMGGSMTVVIATRGRKRKNPDRSSDTQQAVMKQGITADDRMGTNITNQKSKETTKWQDSTIWQCRKTLPKTTVYQRQNHFSDSVPRQSMTPQAASSAVQSANTPPKPEAR